MAFHGPAVCDFWYSYSPEATLSKGLIWGLAHFHLTSFSVFEEPSMPYIIPTLKDKNFTVAKCATYTVI